MKVLVLGATGSLGGSSTIALCEAGHDVVACGRRQDRPEALNHCDCEYHGGFFLESSETYKSLPTDIDAVVHLAGAMPGSVGTSPTPYVNSIVLGMVNLLEWMRLGKCRRIVFNTTPLDLSYKFGSPDPVDADEPRSFPHNGGDHAIYTICKNAAVDVLSHYQIAYGFKPCVFRHRTIYKWTRSPYYLTNGAQKLKPWRKMVQQCIEGAPIEAWGGHESKKELLYIDDFTSAVCQAVQSEACGIFNLPGVRPYTVVEMAEGLAAAFCSAGNQSTIIPVPEKRIANQLLLNGEETWSKLGWKAKIDWPTACQLMHELMIRDN